jgi:outer membrane protein TolC
MKMKTVIPKILRWGVGIVLLGTVGVQAQQVAAIDLDQCIKLAQSRGQEAKIAEKTVAASYNDLRAFKAGLLPQLRFDANTPGILRSINQILQPNGTFEFRQQNQAFSSATFSVSQQIAPTGGQVFASSGLTRLDVFGSSGYRLYQSSPMLVGISQPLFSYNSLRWQNKIQPMQYRVAERRYMESLEDIAVAAAGKYFDVYIAQMTLENAKFNLDVTDSVYTISEGRYRVGKIAENDLLQTELAFLNAQANLNQAEIALKKARIELAISLGLENPEAIQVQHPEGLDLIKIDEEFALLEAKSNRSDLLDYESRGMQAESAVAQAKANARLNASLNASYGLNQSGNTLEDVYSQPKAQQTASIGIGIPILQWGRGKAQVQAAELRSEQIHEQITLDQRRLERDVRFQVMDFVVVQQQLIIAAKADTIALRRFDVAKNRYLIGKIDITNLQIAQSEKDNARRQYIQALKQYWVAYFQLRRATLYDFVKGEKLRLPEDQWED